MRLGLNVGYWGLGMTAADQLDLVKEAEAPGRPRRHDGDDGRDAGPALRRADAAWDRLVRAAGGGGLARATVREAARAYARVRGDPPEGAGPRAARVRGRYLPAAAAGRARQGAQADDRPGAGADTDLHRVDRASEHRAHGRDRRRLAADLLLPRARRPGARAAGRGGGAGGPVARGRELRNRTGGERLHRRRRGPRPPPNAALHRPVRRRDGVARAEFLQPAGAAIRLRGRGARDPGALPRREEGRGGSRGACGADRHDHPRGAARKGPRPARRVPRGGRGLAYRGARVGRPGRAPPGGPRSWGDALSRRFLVAAFGDPGHTFPAIALGAELARRGHEVTLETWSRWREPGEREGMRFAAAPGDEGFPPPDAPMKPYVAAGPAAGW